VEKIDVNAPRIVARRGQTGTMCSVIAPAKVLVVEDEAEIGYLIELALADAQLDVRTVADGDRALAQAREWLPDVVLLDVNIPGPDGFEVCRQLRLFSDAYVIMLTGRADEVDKLVGLSVGADDYLTKPFSPRELVARVQAMLRRPHDLAHARAESGAQSASNNGKRTLGPVEIDLGSRQVWARGELIGLTKLEFDLLVVLTDNVRQVLTRDQLRERVWGGSWLADEHAVDVHMSNLRRKLSEAGEDEMITTVRGVGYRITPRAVP
jgi:DNA-binding response OmpR family regulator